MYAPQCITPNSYAMPQSSYGNARIDKPATATVVTTVETLRVVISSDADITAISLSPIP